MVLNVCDNTTLVLHRLKQCIDQYFIELRAEDESTGGPKGNTLPRGEGNTRQGGGQYGAMNIEQ